MRVMTLTSDEHDGCVTHDGIGVILVDAGSGYHRSFFTYVSVLFCDALARLDGSAWPVGQAEHVEEDAEHISTRPSSLLLWTPP